MADTITLKSSAYDGRYLQLTCTQVKDELNGKSKIQWTLSAIGGEVNYYSTGPTTVNINGTQVYYKARTKWSSEEFPAKKGSVNGEIEVEHDNDGTKSISVSLKTVIYYGTSQVKTYSATWELDPVPKGAYIVDAPSTFTNTTPPTVAYANPKGDEVASIEIGIADAPTYGFAYTVPLREVNKTGEQLTYAFEYDDIEIFNRFVGAYGSNSNKTYDTAFFVLRTTLIDGTVYEDFKGFVYTMEEAEDTKPTVTAELAAVNPPTVPETLTGVYIRGKSSVSATITAEGRYNAAISSYALKVGKENFSSTSNTIASSVIDTAGDSVEIIVSATDTRGFTGEAKQSIAVLDYSKPMIEPHSGDTAILCHRSDDEGKRKGGSTKVWLRAKISYYSLEGNNGCALQWRAKLIDAAWNDQEWNTIAENKAEAGSFEFSDFVCDNEFYQFSLNTAYSVQIRAIDDLGEYEIKEFEIPTQEVALHLGKYGKWVSIGDYCDYDNDEPYTFRSAWRAKFDKGICPIDLYDNKDFNDLINVTGYYVGQSKPDVVGCKNYPTVNTGMLEVTSAMFLNDSTEKSWGFAYQTYRDYTGAIYTRSYYSSSGWTEWKKII